MNCSTNWTPGSKGQQLPSRSEAIRHLVRGLADKLKAVKGVHHGALLRSSLE